MWLDKPWMWKFFVFLSVPLLITALLQVNSSPGFAAVVLLLALVDLVLALLAYRAVRHESGTDSPHG